MSFSYIHCILPVSNGRRVQSTRSNGSSVWHALYDTTFETDNGTSVSGIVRILSPSSMALLVNNSLVDVDGKIMFSIGKKTDEDGGFILEPIRMSPFCVNPLEEESDSFLPIDTVPCINILGEVVGNVVNADNGDKYFDVKAGCYIQNKEMECIYRCRFSTSSRRAKDNLPITGSAICVIGRAHSTVGVKGSGILILTVEEIIYNPGNAHTIADDVNTIEESPSPSPSRKLWVKKKNTAEQNNLNLINANVSSSPGKPLNSGTVLNSNSFPNPNLMPYPNLRFVPYSNQPNNINFIPYPFYVNYDPNLASYSNSGSNSFLNLNSNLIPYTNAVPNANGTANPNAAFKFNSNNLITVPIQNPMANLNLNQSANPVPAKYHNKESGSSPVLDLNVVPNPSILNDNGPNMIEDLNLNNMSALNDGAASSSNQKPTQKTTKRLLASKKAAEL